MENIGETFLKNLYAVRKRRLGLTQSEAAERIGISLRYYQQLEKGDSWPSAEVLSSICRGLACSPAFLLGGQEPDVATPFNPSDLSLTNAGRVLARLESVSPNRRAAAMAILFDDHTIAPDVPLDQMDRNDAKPR